MTTAKINNNAFIAFGKLLGKTITATAATRKDARKAFSKEAQAIINRNQLKAV